MLQGFMQIYGFTDGCGVALYVPCMCHTLFSLGKEVALIPSTGHNLCSEFNDVNFTPWVSSRGLLLNVTVRAGYFCEDFILFPTSFPSQYLKLLPKFGLFAFLLHL